MLFLKRALPCCLALLLCFVSLFSVPAKAVTEVNGQTIYNFSDLRCNAMYSSNSGSYLNNDYDIGSFPLSTSLSLAIKSGSTTGYCFCQYYYWYPAAATDDEDLSIYYIPADTYIELDFYLPSGWNDSGRNDFQLRFASGVFGDTIYFSADNTVSFLLSSVSYMRTMASGDVTGLYDDSGILIGCHFEGVTASPLKYLSLTQFTSASGTYTSSYSSYDDLILKVGEYVATPEPYSPPLFLRDIFGGIDLTPLYQEVIALLPCLMAVGCAYLGVRKGIRFVISLVRSA